MQQEQDSHCAINSFLQFGVTIDSPNLFYLRVTDINNQQLKIPYRDRNCTISTLLQTYLKITSQMNRSSTKKAFMIGSGPLSGQLAPLDEKLVNLQMDDREICFIVREYENGEMEKCIENIKWFRESNGWMDIIVNVLGRTVSQKVKGLWSLRQFKKIMIDKFEQLKHVEQSWIKIQYKGFFLANQNQKIQNCQIKQNSMIMLILNTPANKQIKFNPKLDSHIYVNIKFNEQKTGRVKVNPTKDTIMKIKQEISIKLGINPYNLSLIFGGMQLKNSCTINQYNIVNQAIIHLCFNKSQYFHYVHPDTQIMMGNGQVKPISKLKQLDQVQTIDPRTQKLSKSSVVQIQTKSVKDYMMTNLDNYQNCFITSGDICVELTNGEVVNLKRLCYQCQFQNEYKWLLKRVGGKDKDSYRIKAMAHHELPSQINFYRLVLLKSDNYIANGVIIHRQYINIGKLGPFNSIQRYLTLPIYNDLNLLKLKKKIGELCEINWQKITLQFDSVKLTNNDMKLSQINLKNYHLVLMKVIEQIQQVNSFIMMNSLKEEEKYIYLQVKKDKRIKVQFYKYRLSKCQDIMGELYPHYKSSYFFSFAELILFPSDILDNITKSKLFQQNQITIMVIKSDKFAFVKKMKVEASRIKNYSFLKEEEQKQISLLDISSSHLTSTDTLSNASSQNQLQNQSILSNQSNSSVKNCYYKSFKTLFNKHSSRKYKKSIEWIIKNYQDQENMRKNVKDFDEIYDFIKELYVEMNLLRNYIGKCYVGLKNFRFSQFFNKGNTFYWHSFTSASKNEVQIRNILLGHSGTLFHINSLTGKSIEHFSLYPQEQQILFLPFMYFLVDRIVSSQKMDEVWISEIPSPVTFEKGIILWVDDQPQENQKYIDQILRQQQHSIQILQVRSTLSAEKWIQQFGWLLNWKNIQFKLISDMTRFEENQQGQLIGNSQAGIDLLESLYKTHGVTAFTLIFCWNKQKAESSIQKRNINQRRYHKVTIHIQDLKQFCKMKPK